MSHDLPEIPLIVYHLIQKEKLYLFGQKIKSPYPFLTNLYGIFEKLLDITEKLWNKNQFIKTQLFPMKRENVLIEFWMQLQIQNIF